jgi:hypothetical protein
MEVKTIPALVLTPVLTPVQTMKKGEEEEEEEEEESNDEGTPEEEDQGAVHRRTVLHRHPWRSRLGQCRRPFRDHQGSRGVSRPGPVR